MSILCRNSCTGLETDEACVADVVALVIGRSIVDDVVVVVIGSVM